MSLGVLNNIAAIYAENNLNQTQSSLQNTLQQLSSGSRINSGADDAAGLSIVNGLQANVSALTQSSQNASDGIGLLQTADGALSQVTNLLNRAVTLATEAANGTLNTNQVSSANQEYQNILQEIGDIGSTTNFNGNSVFTSTAKTVFVSDGTANGANSYNEVVGTLSDGTVGQTGSGNGTLATPTASAPAATTSVQASQTVSTPTASPITPTPVEGVATQTVSATNTTLTTTQTAGALTYVGSTGTYSGTPAVTNGALVSSGGNAYSASALTGAAANGTAFTATDLYSGTIGVQLQAPGGTESQLYTATVAPGSSLQTLVQALNNSFGNNPTTGAIGSAGLQAQDVNNALVVTTAPNTTGQVQIDAPTSSLQVNLSAGTGSGSYQNVTFSGTGSTTTISNIASTTSTYTGGSATVNLGTGLVAGNLNILSATGTQLGTVSFGNGVASVGTALAATFTGGSSGTTTVTYQGAGALAGYTAAYTASSGALVITGPSTLNGAFELSTSATGTSALDTGTTTALTAATNLAGGASLSTTATQTAAAGDSSAITLGTTAVSGSILIADHSGASQGTINFGTGAVGTAGIEAALATAFGAAGTGTTTLTYTGSGSTLNGYSATYNTSSGVLTISQTDATHTFALSTGSGAGALSTSTASAATATVGSTTAAVGTTTPTNSSAVTASYSNITIGTSSGSLNGSDLYSGTLKVQQAGSAQTYTATIAAGSTQAQTIAALNAAFGSNTTTIGASGLQAVASGNAIKIQGTSQVVVDGGASSLSVEPAGTGGYVATTYGGTTVANGYTGGSATAAVANTAVLSGLGANNAIGGEVSIYAGGAATGTALGTINFGNANATSGSFGATQIEAAIAATFTGASSTSGNNVTFAGGSTTTLAGYSATYNTSTGSLTITGPSNGNGFTLGSAITGGVNGTPSELESGITQQVVGTAGTTTLTTGQGFTPTANTLYFGTLNLGGGNTYTITNGGQTAAQILASTTYQGAALAAGVTGSTNGSGSLSFVSTTASATAPTVTLSGGSAQNPATDTYTASTVTFAPTNGTGSTGTFSGTLSLTVGSTTYNATIAAGSTGNSVLAQLNGPNGVFGNSGIVASQDAFGDLVITTPTPTNAATLAADQITVNPSTDLTTHTASTQTLTNANAAAGTLYTGTISYGAVGTTTAGSYTISAGGQTAAQIAAALNTSNYFGTASTGIQASVNSSNQLVFSGPSTGSSEGSSPGVTLTNVIATAPAVTSYSQSTAAFAPTNAGGTFSGTLVVGTVGSTQVSTTVAPGTTLSNLVTQLNNQYLSAGNGIVASAGTGTAAGELILTGPATANNASAATAANNQLTFGSQTDLVASGGSTAGVDFTQANVSTLTASSAQTVLAAVTTAINDVAYQRGIIGADVNELTAASNVASAESVNLTSAQSSIQSTDYGAATSNLAKYQVLSQTGISALAQANSVQQEVLKLLQ